VARYADGLGVDEDLVVAATRASQQALAGLDGAPDLVLAFVCGDDAEAVAEAGARVAELCGARAMIGCSASGVIGGGHAVEQQRSVAVWAGMLPGAELRPFHLEVLRADEGAAVVGLPERSGADEVVVLLVDAWSFPLDGFLRQANEALPGLPLVGGVAEGRAAGQTRLFVDGKAVDRGAVGVVLGGVQSSVVVSQGCRPVGPAMTVTGASGNVLRMLAGSAAVGRVQEVLADLTPADQALASRGLQIGVAMDEYADEHDTGDFLVRSILGTEPETGGLVIGDLVPVGRTVRMQVRDAETADSELRALLGEHEQVGGVLLFSCNGRGASLFGPSLGGADHDGAVVRDLLGASGVAGFFAAGEVGPVGGRNHLHGFTASMLCLP
jgi:small ligand-binding sensory domain FIST